MTNKELETRLLSLEKMVSNLAERTSNRDNTNEGNISNVKAETTSVSVVADEANAQALFTALLTDTLIEAEEE